MPASDLIAAIPVSSADTARGRSSGAHHPIDQLAGGLG